MAYEDELDEMRPLVVARAHGLCQICREQPGTVVHHRLRRSQGGKNELSNLMLLCGPCHGVVHEFPATSFAQGYLLKREYGGTFTVEREDKTC